MFEAARARMRAHARAWDRALVAPLESIAGRPVGRIATPVRELIGSTRDLRYALAGQTRRVVLHKGAARKQETLVGRTLCDRWRVESVLGRGGMSTVYQVRHRNGTRAAIKVLDDPPSRSERTFKRFLREGYLANSVGHPGVVRVVDDQQDADGTLFLVMELLEGQTLEERRLEAGGRLEAEEVFRIAHDILDVLVAAHAKGIVHRDIKPSNVFVTAEGQIKVLDFGVAVLREQEGQDRSLTHSGAALGTPSFMAPEQARGRRGAADARTDVWAVGATMFRLLTGRLVHEGASNANEALIFAATQRAPSIALFVPELSSAQAEVVDRALEFDPADRWPSARAMADAVKVASTGGGPRCTIRAARKRGPTDLPTLHDVPPTRCTGPRSRWPSVRGAAGVALAAVAALTVALGEPAAGGGARGASTVSEPMASEVREASTPSHAINVSTGALSPEPESLESPESLAAPAAREVSPATHSGERTALVTRSESQPNSRGSAPAAAAKPTSARVLREQPAETSSLSDDAFQVSEALLNRRK